jgi:hypothetical protein
MVGTITGANAMLIDQHAPEEPPAHQREGERHAQQQGEDCRRATDVQRAPGGIDPLRIVEIALVPLPRQAGRRELHVGCRRAERQREDDQQRRHQEEVDDQPHHT